ELARNLVGCESDCQPLWPQAIRPRVPRSLATDRDRRPAVLPVFEGGRYERRKPCPIRAGIAAVAVSRCVGLGLPARRGRPPHGVAFVGCAGVVRIVERALPVVYGGHGVALSRLARGL